MMSQLTSDYYLNRLAKDTSLASCISHAQEFNYFWCYRVKSALDLYRQGLAKQNSVLFAKANRVVVDTAVDAMLLPYRMSLRVWAK